MQRPTSVTVFGILNIVFSWLGFCGVGFTALVLFGGFGGDQAETNPVLRLQKGTFLVAWNQVTLVLSAISLVVLFIAGIGLLNMRSWARKLSIGYSLYTLASTALGMLIFGWFITIPLIQEYGENTGPEAGAAIVGAVGGFAGGCLGLIYPLLLWYFMSRPLVVAAIDGVEPVPATGDLPPHVESSNPYVSPLTAPISNEVDAPPGPVESVVETFIPSQNGPALASYYLGLFSLFPCLGFPLGVAAVYYGVRGVRNVRQNPAVRGGAHAWVGVICGGLFGLFNFLLLVGFVIAMIAAAVSQRR
jgi:hypothetical protein